MKDKCVFLLVPTADRLVQAGHAKNIVAGTISRFVPKVQHDTPISKDEMETGLCSLLEVNNGQYVTETTDCFPTTDDKIDDFFLSPPPCCSASLASQQLNLLKIMQRNYKSKPHYLTPSPTNGYTKMLKAVGQYIIQRGGCMTST